MLDMCPLKDREEKPEMIHSHVRTLRTREELPEIDPPNVTATATAVSADTAVVAPKEECEPRERGKDPNELRDVTSLGMTTPVSRSSQVAPSTPCQNEEDEAQEREINPEMDEKKENDDDDTRIEWRRAKFDFQAEEPDELSMMAGELIRILDKPRGEWWLGEACDGTRGMFPKDFMDLE
jgi:hypothetical protein